MPHTSRRLRAALVATASATLVAAALPAPEPLGIGDRLFPQLGNPGYDVLSYDISLTYHGRNTEPLDAVTGIDARTTAPLERINLDFAQGTVRSVEVDGRPSEFATKGEDLVIRPPDRLPAGAPVHITVRHTSDPSGDPARGGWVPTADGLAMANQADAAHRVFPGNDHPADKAYFTFRVTAPKDLTVVAGGLPTGRQRHGATTTWTYRTAHPMATELAQVSIGRSAVLHRTGPRGLPVRDVVPSADRDTLEPWLDKTPAQLAWLEEQIGPYPFETYGLLVADTETGFELETQTLSLFERSLFTEPGYPAWYIESIMVHELAHQWFGNSVSPRVWSDLWLNEGHATWYEARYAEDHADKPLEQRMREAYTRSDAWRAAGGPPAHPDVPSPDHKINLFRPVVYDGSALVLYALRQEIGAAAFDRLERTWVRAHRDRSATTADFTRLASRIAGKDLTAFFDGWLHGKKTPPMPGHPDWTSAKPRAAGGAQGPAPAPKPE
ncbi:MULTISPECIES: M1 family metallopeptidase [unclassified Streptomyces]|uniref:M1 family metallopeptidase n=1 Tax=unclassified Streptomyces TaxID=2593676 RepID=UPI0001C19889|nr:MULTISPECIES: M1 family metallopeptidase [unclassified Streptomyces]AEN12783.1 Peptidase M1 membrane alanine aminopeptidase [Streptomyces sp. SirexAA-E]MYR66215.1 M1 family peptidase [Streptomyces sp. SID4939]MYT65654.1 M1 family peptidase [Streptomyces sp. SID8357]MYT84310.1 M1 family peptidase [Streptomyces sp. SID8360]MYW40236.1 M1 family peptidase [Streptomyces sp. SID1]